MKYPDLQIDFDQLLEPITLENPVGNDLRMDHANTLLYYQLKDIRAVTRNIERKSMVNPINLEIHNNWHNLLVLAYDALRLHTKDLEIATWLLEALLRLQGFMGLYKGVRLIRQLIEKYWPHLYPSQEESPTDKIAALIGLNGEKGNGVLIAPILNTSLTSNNLQNTDYSAWHYQQALTMAASTDSNKRDQRPTKETPSLQLIKQAALQTPASFSQSLISNLQLCISEFIALSSQLAELISDFPPNFSHIIRQLEQCLDFAKDIYQEQLIDQVFSSSVAAESQNIMDTQNQEFKPDNLPIDEGYQSLSRTQALHQLRQIANYFRKAEPHSPLSYMLERVMYYSALDFPNLLKEIINDEGYYKRILSQIC